MESVKDVFVKNIKSEFGKLNAQPDQKNFMSYRATESDKYAKMATEEKIVVKPITKKMKEKILKKTNGKLENIGKKENLEATSSSSSGAYSGPLFGEESEFIKKSESETPNKIEAKEATTSSSVGAYSQPSIWAPSKKKWGPSKKTQIPGGAFVKVKKKCKTFPYCNQGDINALVLSKNSSLREAVAKVAKKLDLNENVIFNILVEEYSKIKKRDK